LSSNAIPKNPATKPSATIAPVAHHDDTPGLNNVSSRGKDDQQYAYLAQSVANHLCPRS